MICCGCVKKQTDDESEPESKPQPEARSEEVTSRTEPSNEATADVASAAEPVTAPVPMPAPVAMETDAGDPVSNGTVEKVPAEDEVPGSNPADAATQDDQVVKREAKLTRWWSEEEGEPPARAVVGRDEIELRRHKFFEELVQTQEAAATHHVRFDPMGPELMNRPGDKMAASLEVYNDIIQGPLQDYLQYSRQIGGDVATHSKMVDAAFQAQKDYLIIATKIKAPSQPEQAKLLKPVSQTLEAIVSFRENNRGSEYFNHISAISECMMGLGWVTVTPTPAPYVKEMNDAGQYYLNRVLKFFKEKGKVHADWVKAINQTLGDLQKFVKQYHTTGLVWTGTEAFNENLVNKSGGVPPPPPGLPPPPPVMPSGDLPEADSTAQDRSALFAQINQGEAITKGLKKVTSEMQTHKNQALRTGPAPFKAPASTPKPFGSPATNAVTEKPPRLLKEGKKWMVEYQKNNNNLVIDEVEMNNVVYMFKCENSTLQVKGKLNSIVLDSCRKSSVVFDAVVASVEFINCQSVQMQVLSKVPTISIDKTDGCQMYLNDDSLGVEIVSSKSSEMNVMVPKAGGDYVEMPIPEQYKTTVGPKGLVTIVVESKS